MIAKNSPLRVALWTGVILWWVLTGLAVCVGIWLAGGWTEWLEALNGRAAIGVATFLLPMAVGAGATLVVLLLFRRLVLRRLIDLFDIFNRLERPKHAMILGLTTNWEEFFRDRARVWSVNQENQIEALKDQDDFRRSFIGNLAHELKTPLQSFQGYILTLIDGAIDDPVHAMKFLQKAAKSSERMKNLIEDLDVISKEESGRLDIRKGDFDVIEIVQEILDNEERRAQRSNIKLELDVASPASLFAVGDSGWITQVISNLVVNSVNYGRQDGTGLTTISVREEPSKVFIEVQDNGIGIDKESQDRIFERFYRVDKSRSRAAGGSGLGLAICKHLIEAHNERIGVKSAPGEGSTFFFRLPKAS